MRRTLLLSLLLVALLAIPAASARVTKTACTPTRYLAFINPMPYECATLDYGNVNDFCATVFGVAGYEHCVEFIGPPL